MQLPLRLKTLVDNRLAFLLLYIRNIYLYVFNLADTKIDRKRLGGTTTILRVRIRRRVFFEY